MLIPRTFANKIMKELSNENLAYNAFLKLNREYIRLIIISSSLGLCFSIIYLFMINPQFGETIITISIAITAVLVSAQFGFISLTYLSLQGADQLVAKMNLIVLLVTALVAIPAMMGFFAMQALIYFIVFTATLSFIIRNKLAMQKVVNYIE
jgi:hypothetical protein